MKLPKIRCSVLLPCLAAAWIFVSISSALAEPAASDLSHIVQFELGKSNFASGDNITIQQMRGTSDVIKVGETYSVDGTYELASHDEADIAFYATTVLASGPTPVGHLQHIRIKRGHGTFHLVKTMSEDGYLHVSFYPVPSGESFGGVYFGQGDRVLRSWASASRSAASGPNRALLEYLGSPVQPPANMDARYTKEGLTDAVQSAAQNAGITVKKLTIDDSEFPFLIGVVCAGSDASKLKAEIKKMDGYEYGGSIGNDANPDGSDTCNVFNIVPYEAYPEGAKQQIYHRLWLRQQVFYDRINGQK